MDRIKIVKEPIGETYRSLLTFAAHRCESFSLVWRRQFHFKPSADEVLRALQPFLVGSIETSKWPGTELIGHTALVRYYRITDASIDELRKPEGLYSWLQPSLPEDLVFYTPEKLPWLVTVSHESEGWFEDPSLRIEEVRLSVIGIIVSQRLH